MGQKEDSARVWMVGCVGISDKLAPVEVPETVGPDTLATLALALDDLRALGELDLRLNHPASLKAP